MRKSAKERERERRRIRFREIFSLARLCDWNRLKADVNFMEESRDRCHVALPTFATGILLQSSKVSCYDTRRSERGNKEMGGQRRETKRTGIVERLQEISRQICRFGRIKEYIMQKSASLSVEK